MSFTGTGLQVAVALPAPEVLMLSRLLPSRCSCYPMATLAPSALVLVIDADVLARIAGAPQTRLPELLPRNWAAYRTRQKA